MNISTNLLNRISFIYLSISLVIFIAGWYNPIFATISLLALFFILKNIFSDKTDDKIIISKDHLIIISIISITWVILSGIGGFFWQEYNDWQVRNAIMHDLINFSYPVMYANNTSFVYYFGFILPPALIGKLALFLHCNAYLAFNISNIFSIFYYSFGIFLISLYFIKNTNAEGQKTIAAIAVLILFAGLNIFLFKRPYNFDIDYDWHPPYMWICGMRSMMNVPHVAVPIWLVAMLFWHNKQDITYYGIYILFILFFCPQILLLFGLYFIPCTIHEVIENRSNIKMLFRKIFDIKNLLSFLVLIPPIVLFYKSNYISNSDFLFFNQINENFYYALLWNVIIYAILIFYNYYKDIFFLLTVFCLTILPMPAISTRYDFAAKAIIPLYLIFSVYIAEFLLSNINKVIKYILTIVLILGSLTPIQIIHKNLQLGNMYPTLIVKDDLKTFDGKFDENILKWQGFWRNINYACFNPKKYFFWKYIAK